MYCRMVFIKALVRVELSSIDVVTRNVEDIQPCFDNVDRLYCHGYIFEARTRGILFKAG